MSSSNAFQRYRIVYEFGDGGLAHEVINDPMPGLVANMVKYQRETLGRRIVRVERQLIETITHDAVDLTYLFTHPDDTETRTGFRTDL